MSIREELVIRWSHISFEHRWLRLAVSAKGLCYVYTDDADDLAGWTRKWYPGHRLVRDEQSLQPYAMQFMEYFNGLRSVFDFPLDMRGTPFQLAVWEELGRIPFGETRTYREIAEAIGKPSASRAVGGAIGANPLMIVIPCHRVIGSNGSLTGFSGGLDWKSRLLQIEGVPHVHV